MRIVYEVSLSISEFDFYRYKCEVEAQMGAKLTDREFAEEYLEEFVNMNKNSEDFKIDVLVIGIFVDDID